MKKNILKFASMVLPMMLISCTNPSSTQGSAEKTVPTSIIDKNTNTSSSQSSSEDEKDPYVIDPSDSQWPEEVTNSMVKYLGGQVLPYVKMGTDIDIQYNERDSKDNYKSSLVLTGGMFVAGYLDSAKTEYKNHDWETNIWKNKSFYASREKQNLEVEVTSTSKGLFQLTAYWNEPFNPTSVTEWDAATVLSMKEHFGQFYNIPFAYMGTKDYVVSFSEKPESAMTVVGGLWDDQVCEEFIQSYLGWSISYDDTDLTKITATKTEANGTKLIATISEVKNRANLVIGIEEKFDKTNQDSWSSTINEAYSKVTTESLPYVYLGTVYPTIVTSETNSRKITIKGDKWDDSIVENAKSTFESKGYVEVTTTEEDDDDTIQIKLSKTTTSSTFYVVIKKVATGTEGEYYPLMTASVSENFDSSLVSDWSDSVKSAFASKFSDTMSSIMPFMYLGTANAFIDTSYNRDFELVINGGAYDERILSLFDQAFSDWVIATEHTSLYTASAATNSNVVYRLALKNFDDVTYKVGLFTMYTGVDKTVYLEITKSFKDTVSGNVTEWSAATQTILTDYFGAGVTIPHFDMGVTSSEVAWLNGKIRLQPSFIYLSSNYYYMDIYTKLKADGWNVNFKFNGNFIYGTTNLAECVVTQITATKTFGEDKLLLNFNITRPNSKGDISSTSGNYIIYDEEYNEEEAPEDGWGEELNALITSTYKFTLPYFYLGTKHNKYKYDSASNTLTIAGNNWSTEIASGDKTTNKSPIITNARAVLTQEAGFEVASSSTSESTIASNASAKLVVTHKVDDDNQVTISITKASNYGIVSPIITITTTEPNYYDGSVTEWNDEVKNALNDNLPSNMSMPYLYLGTATPTVVVNNTTFAELPYMTITGATWNNQVVGTVSEMLEADGGWTITESGTGTGATLSAYKIYSDYSALRLYVKRVGSTKNGYFNTLYVLIDKPETTATLKSWSTFDVKASATAKDSTTAVSIMDPKFNNSKLPDFLYTKDSESYVATYTLNTANSNRSVTVKSPNSSNYHYFSPSYVYRAKAILESNGYEVTLNPFGSATYFMPSLYATKKNDDGSSFYMTYGAAYDSSYNSFTNTATTATAVKNRTNLVGFKVATYYLPAYSANTEAAWGNDTTGNSILTKLKTNAVEIPYLNLGAPSSEIYVVTQTSSTYMPYISLKGYNYDESSLATIKKTLEDAGWDMHYAYYFDRRIYQDGGGYTDVEEALPYQTGSIAELYLSGTYTDADNNVYVLSVTQDMTTAKTGSLLSAYTEVRIAKPKIQ